MRRFLLRRGFAGRPGVTLIEILVAAAIFSIVMGAVFQFGTFVSRRLFMMRDATDHLNQMTLFLNAIAADVRDGRQILYSGETEIGIWLADENADSEPDPAEMAGYAWDGVVPGTVFRQAEESRRILLTDVRDFKFRYDRESPVTRHVMLEMTLGKSETAAQTYHYSLNLRASEVAISK
ncbi:type II secretion system protein [bacterium]|nr:type II secretion system protein [bacterium]